MYVCACVLVENNKSDDKKPNNVRVRKRYFPWYCHEQYTGIRNKALNWRNSTESCEIYYDFFSTAPLIPPFRGRYDFSFKDQTLMDQFDQVYEFNGVLEGSIWLFRSHWCFLNTTKMVDISLAFFLFALTHSYEAYAIADDKWQTLQMSKFWLQVPTPVSAAIISSYTTCISAVDHLEIVLFG